MIAQKTKTFALDYASELEDRSFTGTFTCRKQTMADRSKIAVRKSQLSGGLFCCRDDSGKPTGQGIDEDTDYFNWMLAVLEVVLVSKPDWFKMNEITDVGVISAVFKEVMEFENSFFRRRGDAEGAKESVQSSSGASGTKHQATNHPNDATPVVGSEARDSLDG